jgi:hypothetical protein
MICKFAALIKLENGLCNTWHVGRKKSWGSKGTTASQNIGPSVNKTVAT